MSASDADAGAELLPICEPLGLKPTALQLASLLDYLDLLQRWNATYNLTAVRDRAGMLSQHLADCLAVMPALNVKGVQGRVLDVGSGGGLPGVVAAVMRPDLDVTCVDAVGKKAAFVRQVAATLGLRNLHAAHARVELLASEPFQLVCSRAFATLPLFTALTDRHLAPEGIWMAMKGREPGDEIAALPTSIDVFHVEQLQVPSLDAQRCLIWMRRRGPV